MLPKSEFNKNVLTVMTGTGLAQVITLVFSPILTRIFTPEEFGIFYLFSALSDILVIPATGRLELAILIPEKKNEAANIFWAAGISSSIFSILLLIFIYFFSANIGIWLGEPKLSQWLFFLPISIFIVGWLSSFHYWHNRFKRFKVLTGTKIAESTTNVSTRIGLGFLKFGTGGLIVGTLLGRLATVLSYFYFFNKKDKISFPRFRRKAVWKQIIRFKNFPKNMVPAGLFQVGSLQIPNLLLNLFYTATVVGHFGFMNRILRAPLGLLGRSFEEVFKQKASEELRQFGHCKNIFSKTIKKLLAIAILPFLIFFFAAPWAFQFIFGEEWVTAGIYAQIFTIPLFINFLTGSLASIFYLKEKTKIFSMLNFLQLSFVIFAFFINNFYDWNSLTLIYWLAGAYTISYLLTLFFLVKIVYEEEG